MTVRCPGCERDMDATASICVQCRGTFEVALANVASYHFELEAMRARLTRFGTGGGRSSGEARLGMDLRFDAEGRGTAVEAAVRLAVVGWTRYVLEHVPPVVGPTCGVPCLHLSCSTIRRCEHPRDTVASCCAYLQRFSDWLRVSPVGAEALADVCAVERKLRRLVDRPADTWYAGVCGSQTDLDDGSVAVCARELYAEDAAVFVRCRDCGCTYDVAGRRKALLVEAEDREATVSAIVRIVTTLGDVNVSEARMQSRINTWVWRGKLQPHGMRVVDGRVRPTYRVGAILDLLGRDTA